MVQFTFLLVSKLKHELSEFKVKYEFQEKNTNEFMCEQCKKVFDTLGDKINHIKDFRAEKHLLYVMNVTESKMRNGN